MATRRRWQRAAGLSDNYVGGTKNLSRSGSSRALNRKANLQWRPSEAEGRLAARLLSDAGLKPKVCRGRSRVLGRSGQTIGS